MCSGALLASRYFEAAENSCAIDQLKPGLQYMPQYLFFCYIKSTEVICRYRQMLDGIGDESDDLLHVRTKIKSNGPF